MNNKFYIECDFCGKREYADTEEDLLKKKRCFYCENELKRFNYYEYVVPSSILTTEESFDAFVNSNEPSRDSAIKNKPPEQSESSWGCYLGIVLFLGIIYYFGGWDGILGLLSLCLFIFGFAIIKFAFEWIIKSNYGCLVMLLIIAIAGGYVYLNNKEEQDKLEKQRQIVAEQRLKEAQAKEQAERLSLTPEIENRLSVLGYSGDIEESYNQFCNDYKYQKTDDFNKRLSFLDEQIQKNKNIAFINNLVKDAKNKTGQKKWKRFSEAAKAEYWQKVYVDSLNKGLSKDTFWQNFGTLIAQSFNPPFTKRLPSANWRCPFSIKTTDSNSMYYVKLTECRTGKVQTIFFKGYSFETAVPPGNYSFKYACGDIWYGPVFLFGPNGGYHKSSDILDFYNDGYHLCGHTVELIKQRNGNFHTQNIDEEEF